MAAGEGVTSAVVAGRGSLSDCPQLWKEKAGVLAHGLNEAMFQI